MYLWMQARKAYGVVAYIYQGRQPSPIFETCIAFIKESTLPKLESMTAVMHQAVKFIVRSFINISVFRYPSILMAQ